MKQITPPNYAYGQSRPIFLTIQVFFAGGTLGLFTGMSLLSIIECIYWGVVILSRVISHFIFKITRGK